MGTKYPQPRSLTCFTNFLHTTSWTLECLLIVVEAARVSMKFPHSK